MNPLRKLSDAWRRATATVIFSRRQVDPKTGAAEVVTYVAVPIPGSGNYEVTIREVSFYGETERQETWSQDKLVRLRERVAGSLAEGC